MQHLPALQRWQAGYGWAIRAIWQSAETSTCSAPMRVWRRVHEVASVQVAVALSRNWKPAMVEGMPDVFTGGWVGYCGYDTVRYVYSSKALSISDACDTQALPEHSDVVIMFPSSRSINTPPGISATVLGTSPKR